MPLHGVVPGVAVPAEHPDRVDVGQCGFVDQTFCQCGRGKAVNANTSTLASCISGPILGNIAGELVTDLGASAVAGLLDAG